MSFIEIRNVEKEFITRNSIFGAESKFQALKGVSLSIERGETVGLVGESGSGKSTLGRCLIRLMRPTAGEIFFEGRDIAQLPEKELKGIRRRMQIVFQDPFSSLNPRFSVWETLEEPLVIHKVFNSAADRGTRVRKLLDLVGLPGHAGERYPHEMSGGQRQRVGIARALALSPDLVVCDEPVSSLDVSYQAQILNLLVQLQDELKLTYLFISHDLRVIHHLSHRIAVMHQGKIVEVSPWEEFLESAKDPYTRSLIAACPRWEAGG